MASLDRESLLTYAVVALLGAGGGSTGTLYGLGDHTHPEIIRIQYEMEVEDSKTRMFAMDKASIPHDHPDYIIAATQLATYTELLSGGDG